MGGTPARGRDPKPDTIEVTCPHCGAQVQAMRTTANQHRWVTEVEWTPYRQWVTSYLPEDSAFERVVPAADVFCAVCGVTPPDELVTK